MASRCLLGYEAVEVVDERGNPFGGVAIPSPVGMVIGCPGPFWTLSSGEQLFVFHDVVISMVCDIVNPSIPLSKSTDGKRY